MRRCPECAGSIRAYEEENSYECENCGEIGYLDRLEESYIVHEGKTFTATMTSDYVHFVVEDLLTTSKIGDVFEDFVAKIDSEIRVAYATVSRGGKNVIIIEGTLAAESLPLIRIIDEMRKERIIKIHSTETNFSGTSINYKIILDIL